MHQACIIMHCAEKKNGRRTRGKHIIQIQVYSCIYWKYKCKGPASSSFFHLHFVYILVIWIHFSLSSNSVPSPHQKYLNDHETKSIQRYWVLLRSTFNGVLFFSLWWHGRNKSMSCGTEIWYHYIIYLPIKFLIDFGKYAHEYIIELHVSIYSGWSTSPRRRWHVWIMRHYSINAIAPQIQTVSGSVLSLSRWAHCLVLYIKCTWQWREWWGLNGFGHNHSITFI